jgi:transcriptional regulator with XRE-family HTH domain
MSARNALSTAPPHAVELAIVRLGGDLRTARLHRNLTLDEVAARIGAGRRAVADAEHGKATTAIAVYAGLLWAYDLLGGLERLADPARDEEGQTLAKAQGRTRARRAGGLDNDF